MTSPKIAYQGEPGAYGHQACREAKPDHEPLACPTFEDALAAVREGRADLGMIAVENSTYGRVADVHQLLPDSGLHIVEEAFVRVRIALMAPKGAKLEGLRRVRSMSILLGQARGFLNAHGLERLNWSDNAAAARKVAEMADPAEGALASPMAAEVYGLDLLAEDIEDEASNTTRFYIMARDVDLQRRGSSGMITSFVFRVRNIPAALYKAMGGFATNGVNMTKLESYMVGGNFTATQFYAEIEGHPDDAAVMRAMEELDYFTDYLHVMGVFPAAKPHHAT
ncbi:prephenate dehydratase [Pseudoroseicyclus tamaricis]|uniref:prephenate dehydratase n=1 Tax=Pseudoroseicyclus tamaricis TaxID=2705421 RepID=A0A6B2K0B2_9RHOB|nr:prephenate dehydratase [Pseudoroseicyclus tamaricis]NDU99755.1 prephenate dehydratase [Pseudoroseicyclus tamaricis]